MDSSAEQNSTNGVLNQSNQLTVYGTISFRDIPVSALGLLSSEASSYLAGSECDVLFKRLVDQKQLMVFTYPDNPNICLLSPRPEDLSVDIYGLNQSSLIQEVVKNLLKISPEEEEENCKVDEAERAKIVEKLENILNGKKPVPNGESGSFQQNMVEDWSCAYGFSDDMLSKIQKRKAVKRPSFEPLLKRPRVEGSLISGRGGSILSAARHQINMGAASIRSGNTGSQGFSGREQSKGAGAIPIPKGITRGAAMVAKIKEANVNPSEWRKGETIQQFSDRLQAITQRITEERMQEFRTFSARLKPISSVVESINELYKGDGDLERALSEMLKVKEEAIAEEEDEAAYIKMVGAGQAFVACVNKDSGMRQIDHRERGDEAQRILRERLFVDPFSSPVEWSEQRAIRELEFQSLVVLEVVWCYPASFPDEKDVTWLSSILRGILRKSGTIARMTRFLNGPVCDFYGSMLTDLIQLLYDELNQAPPEVFYENRGPEPTSPFAPLSPTNSVLSYDSGPSSILQPPSLPPPASQVQRRLRFGRSNTNVSLQTRPQVMVRPKELPNGASRVLENLGGASQKPKPLLPQSVRSGSVSGSEVSSKQVRRNLFSNTPIKSRALFRNKTAPVPMHLSTLGTISGVIPSASVRSKTPSKKSAKGSIKDSPALKSARTPSKLPQPTVGTPIRDSLIVGSNTSQPTAAAGTPSKASLTPSKQGTPKKSPTPKKHHTPKKSETPQKVVTPGKDVIFPKTPTRLKSYLDSPRVVRSLRRTPGNRVPVLAPDTPSNNRFRPRKTDGVSSVPETPEKDSESANGVSPCVRRSFYSQRLDQSLPSNPSSQHTKIVSKMLADRLASTVRSARSSEALHGSPSRVVFSQIGSASPPVRGTSRLVDSGRTPVKTPVKTPDAMPGRRQLARTLSFTPTKAAADPEIPKPFTSFESVDSGVVLTPRRMKLTPLETTPSKKVHFKDTPQKSATTPMKSILRTRSTNLFGSSESVVPDLPAVQKVELGAEMLCLSPVKAKTPQKENLDRCPTFDDSTPFKVDIGELIEESVKTVNDLIEVSDATLIGSIPCDVKVAVVSAPDTVETISSERVTRNLFSEIEEPPKLKTYLSDDILSVRSGPPVLSPPKVPTTLLVGGDTQLDDAPPTSPQSRKRKSDELLSSPRRTPRRRSSKIESPYIPALKTPQSGIRSESPISLKIRRIGKTHSATLLIEGEVIPPTDFASPSLKGSPSTTSEKRQRYRPMQLTSPAASLALENLLSSPIVTPAKGKTIAQCDSEPRVFFKNISRESDGFSVEEWNVQGESVEGVVSVEQKGKRFGGKRSRRSLCNQSSLDTVTELQESVYDEPLSERRALRARRLSSADSGISGGKTPGNRLGRRSATPNQEGPILRSSSRCSSSKTPIKKGARRSATPVEARRSSSRVSNPTPTKGGAARTATPIDDGRCLRSSSRASSTKSPTKSRRNSLAESDPRPSPRTQNGMPGCEVPTLKGTKRGKARVSEGEGVIETRPRRSMATDLSYACPSSDDDGF